jgi:peptidoglycan/LPS O-acetylase OafA/YrhL
VATVSLQRSPSDHRAAAGPPISAGSRRRGDIQGLRALAVVSVALDHAHVPGFSGGFVGVDVFFVISGYLITQLLLREAQQTGRISLTRFYSRRARRILPAATVVLVATVVASTLLVGFVRASAIVQDSVWAAFFAANVKFSRDETNYFSADSPPSALQHFWSLAVEEQFYLVWPLLLLCVILGLRAFRGRADVRGHDADGRLPIMPIIAVVGLLVAGSLAWCLWLTENEPAAAYFSTPARAWELGLGAACAALAPRIAGCTAWLRSVFGWLGLAGVVLAIVTYDASTAFPGHAALLPVVGVALVIAAGEGPVDGPLQRLLGIRPAQWMGDVSYSFYLWHWPFLVLAAGYLGHPTTVTQNLLLLMAALALSAVTYYGVENPLRQARLLSSRVWRGLAVYPVAVAVTLAGVVVAQAVIDGQVAAASKAPAVTVDSVGGSQPGQKFSTDPTVALVQASVEAARHDVPVPGLLSPSLLDLVGDTGDVGECDYTTVTHQLCRRGDAGAKQVMVVLGDSHARAWIPALEVIAQDTGYAAYYLVKPGCNAGMITPDVGTGAFEGCVAFREWALAQARRLSPDVVVIASDLPPGVVNNAGETLTDPVVVADAVSRGIEATIKSFGPSLGRAIVIGDAPGLPVEPGDCLSQRGATLGECAFPQSERSVLLIDAERRAARASGAHFVDTLAWFCARDLCPSVVGSTVVYRDVEHITTEYALELAAPLQRKLRLR